MANVQGMLQTATLCLAFMFAVASDAPACADRPRASTSASLLQMHGQTVPAMPADGVELCVVQDGRCFDFGLDKRWENVTEFSWNDVQLIVARYGEDLQWLDALPQLPAIVYNRGGSDRLLPAERDNLIIIHQLNDGREDQVFLQHIYDNYEDLPQVTVFLQGWPFGHCPGFMKAVKQTIQALLEPEKVMQLQGAGSVTQGLVPITGTFWQYNVPAGRLGLATSLAEKHFPPDKRTDAMNYARALYKQTCQQVLGGATCPRLEWTAEGAQWAVRRDQIRSTSKSTYARALELGEGWEGKFRGLVMEALWPVLFGAPEWQPSESKVDFIPSLAGAASNRARSNDGFCAMDDGSRKLVFSCQDRAEFCERMRRRGAPTGQRFEEERQLFKIHDAAGPEPWRLEARIQPVLWGATTWMPRSSLEATALPNENASFDPVIVEVDGQLRLRRTIESSLRGVEWNITDFGNNYVLSRTSAGEQLFLGCDQGKATLLPQPTAWVFNQLLDGWVQLQTVEAHLFLALDIRFAGGHLYCQEASGLDKEQAAFLFQALRK
mmetsp:Transcript_6361/g.11620  ORF Transcript_6361/g.11620 Transcript_6361/m.11620 type:complete len:550 (+) Transcript_6361:68-1717(+)